MTSTFFLPKITVITVVFNAVKELEETIGNVLSFPYSSLQHIVIDGGSSDGSAEFLKKSSSVLRYWVSESDNGIYDAMNKGWNVTDEDSFVLFLGAGDKLITLPDMTKYTQEKIIMGNVQIGKINLFKCKADFRLKLGNTVHHQALLVHKSTFKSSPFSLEYKTYSDFDFNQRLQKAGEKFIYDKQFLSFALEGGVSQRFNKLESIRIVQKNYGYLYSHLAKLYYCLRHEI